LYCDLPQRGPAVQLPCIHGFIKRIGSSCTATCRSGDRQYNCLVSMVLSKGSGAVVLRPAAAGTGSTTALYPWFYQKDREQLHCDLPQRTGSTTALYLWFYQKDREQLHCDLPQRGPAVQLPCIQAFFAPLRLFLSGIYPYLQFTYSPAPPGCGARRVPRLLPSRS
jgi:hypothetical protein